MSFMSFDSQRNRIDVRSRLNGGRGIVRGFALSAIALAVVGVAQSSAVAQVKYNDLLKRIPRTANAIMAVNVDGLHNSPIGKEKRWMDIHEENYVNKPFILPPEASWAVIGAMLDPVSNESVWELGVMLMSSDISMRSIARSEKGYVDTINGVETALVPSNAYFINFADKTLGVMYPGHRQAVARWIDFVKNSKESELSPYLKSAAEVLDDKTIQVVLAIDLKDMVRPHALKEKLANSEALKGKKVDLEALGQAITTLQGATLTVSLRDKAYGRLQIDFGGGIHVLTPVAKELILEALDDAGARIEEMKDWKMETSGGSVSLFGVLEPSGLRRIGSVLELPSAKLSADSGTQAPEGPTAKASKAYYDSVQTLVDDLRKTLRDNRDNHAVWMEKYARKIDRLPVLNVDEQLLAFGAQSAERLRQSAVAKRSALVRSGVRKSETYGNYFDGGFGNVNNFNNGGVGFVRSGENERASIQLAENASATKVRVEQWKLIEDDMAKIRQDMTRKYKVEF
ncbi:MAG: hypothetical protein AB7O26_03810 [Planctomycetaceae bacterium]